MREIQSQKTAPANPQAPGQEIEKAQISQYVATAAAEVDTNAAAHTKGDNFASLPSPANNGRDTLSSFIAESIDAADGLLCDKLRYSNGRIKVLLLNVPECERFLAEPDLRSY